MVEARDGARGYGGRERCPDWDADESIVKLVSLLLEKKRVEHSRSMEEGSNREWLEHGMQVCRGAGAGGSDRACRRAGAHVCHRKRVVPCRNGLRVRISARARRRTHATRSLARAVVVVVSQDVCRQPEEGDVVQAVFESEGEVLLLPRRMRLSAPLSGQERRRRKALGCRTVAQTNRAEILAFWCERVCCTWKEYGVAAATMAQPAAAQLQR